MPDATMQTLAANATQAATVQTAQASQATSALAQSTSLNATSLADPAVLHPAATPLSGLAPSLPDPLAAQTSAAGAMSSVDAVGAVGTVDPSTTGSLVDASHSLLGTSLVTAAYLCLILGAIFLAVWLLRRYGPASLARTKGPDNPRIIGRLMLGPKQSVCVVRVHERNLVLGVTEQRITLLAETETPAGRCYEEEDEDEFTRFAEELAEKRKDAADGV